MPSASAELIDIATRHASHFERLKSHEVTAFNEFLLRLDDDLRKQLYKGDVTQFTRTRLEKQIALIREIIAQVYSDYKTAFNAGLKDAATYEAEFEKKSLDHVVINVDFALPTDNQVMAAVFSNPLSVSGIAGGALLDQFFETLPDNTTMRIEGAIRAGFVQGQTTQQIINRIRGTAAANFKNGLLALSQRDAELVARTSLQHVASQARETVWKRNSDIVKKVRMVATLDNRTSTICRSIDGKEYPIDSGPRPPFHISCRTSCVAVLDDRFKVLDQGATRAARGESGGVSKIEAEQTYYEWLKNQPAGFQDSIIGSTRGKLLRDGGLTAQRFSELQLGRNFEPLTLQQMRKLEPLAFEAAGI